MPRFLITTGMNPEYKNWVPGGMDFMWPEFWLAAGEHYEIYSALY